MTANQYPTNAGELLTSVYRGKDDFFLLCKVEKNSGGTRITVENGFPIAVNKEGMRDAILAETGIKLPTRKEISKGPRPDDLTVTVDWDRMYTGAAGAALWVSGQQSQADDPMIYLIQNSPDKPVNPNRFNFPSGLLSDDFLPHAFTEITEETGILLVDEDQLTGLNFDLPPHLPSLKQDFKAAALANRRAQESCIREELAQRHPEHAHKPVQWASVPTRLLTEGLDKVSFSILGQAFDTHAHVLVDEKVKSANVHFPLQADLTGHDFSEILAIDPEQFKRNHGLYTLSQALTLDTIPAPRDYLLRLKQ